MRTEVDLRQMRAQLVAEHIRQLVRAGWRDVDLRSALRSAMRYRYEAGFCCKDTTVRFRLRTH
jgi:ribosomal protein S3